MKVPEPRRTDRRAPSAGVELDAGSVRAVVGRPDDDRLRVTGIGHAVVPAGAISGGLVLDRRAVGAAVARALGDAERGDRAAERVLVATDGEDLRTYHVKTTFERDDADSPLDAAEMNRALREAREDAAHQARVAAGEDAALRGVAAVQLRDDVVGICIDGRDVASPLGYQGRFVDVRTDVALSTLVQASAATAAMTAARRRATATSGIYALGRLLAASGVSDGGVLRLGADVTAFALIREARVVGSRVFGLGRDVLLGRTATLEADARVWASCVLTPLDGVDGPLPMRWHFVGVPESLLALPRALGAALVADRRGSADIAPLRPAVATKLVSEHALHADDLPAAGAAALAAGLLR